MNTSCSLFPRKSLPLRPGFIRVACIPERDPVAYHAGAAQEPRALHRVFAEPIPDRVDRSLEPVAAGTYAGREQVKLTGVIFGERGDADAQRAHGQPGVARREQLKRGLVDLIAGGDRLGLLRL